jgi:hypothetical protein
MYQRAVHGNTQQDAPGRSGRKVGECCRKREKDHNLSAHKRRAPRRARHGRHGKRASIEVLATRRCGGALDGEKELKYCVECKTL